MSNAYLCPNCKTNRTRFNIIDQVPQSVKLDPATGSIVNQYNSNEELDPFHIPYNGASKLIQCAACGVVGEEQAFIKRAQNNPL